MQQLPMSRLLLAAPRWHHVLIVLFTLVAAVLRLYHLDSVPAGLHHDEASNGMLALTLLHNDIRHLPVFFSEYTGKEAGFMYLVALAIVVCGQTILAIRLPAALLGVALVPAIYVAGSRVSGRTTALLAAGITAVAPWLVHVNRIGFRASLLPLLLTLFVWRLWHALCSSTSYATVDKQHPVWQWMSAGILLGLCAYTYTASRLVPLFVVLVCVYLAVWHRPLLREQWRHISIMGGVALLVALPLLWHYVQHPADWGERLEQIGVCGDTESSMACATRIVNHSIATIAMVGWRGDPLGFFNVPNAPALPMPVGWLFYVGCGIALWRIRLPGNALLLLWWGSMVLPGILSHDSPHFLRTIGAAPPTMLLWALPLTAAASFVEQTSIAQAHAVVYRVLQRVVASGILLIATLSSATSYFGDWAHNPARYYDYMGYATDGARATRTVPPTTTLFISEEYYRHPTYLYLSPRTATARWFDARYGVPLPPAPSAQSSNQSHESIYIISPATPVDSRIAAFLSHMHGDNILNAAGQYAYTQLISDAHMPNAEVLPSRPLAIEVGTTTLRGATIAFMPEQQTVYVTLFWQANAPTTHNLRVFLHVVDDENTSAEHLIAQHDVASYPSHEWHTGDRFVTCHTLHYAANQYTEADVAHATLRIGMYDIATGERMPVQQGHGHEAVVKSDARYVALSVQHHHNTIND